MRLRPLISLFGLIFAATAIAQSQTVALTVDDLPFVSTDPGHPSPEVISAAAAKANRKLVAAFHRHRLPVTGFVNQKWVNQLAHGQDILEAWINAGLDLGNHTYSHLDFDDHTVEEFEQEVISGEAGFLPLMQAAGRSGKFFRFPFNHTGDTQEKHDAVAAFLAGRGYSQAPCTIETSDWMFNEAYGRMLANRDRTAAARLRADYLSFTEAQIDYFGKLNRQVVGYDPPQIMLIHDNQLNADVIEQLLGIFREKRYRFVTLSEAESDPVYRSGDTLVTKYGPMWGYRWARERNVKVDGRLEPDPPKWISEYGQNVRSRRARSQF
ncbi:MAG TPA: polysaccharide deacetylase family protein [Terracidiphilus sp.]|jgi:peptidoglycan/xylan/chitin deacetylase (PgdA/CDA1 family)